MHTKRKKKNIGLRILLWLLLLLFLTLAAAIGLFGLKIHRRDSAPAPLEVYGDTIESLRPAQAGTDWGRLLYSAAQDARRLEFGETRMTGLWSCSIPLRVQYLDPEKLGQGVAEEMGEGLAQAAAGASRPEEVYDGELNFREDLTSGLFQELLDRRLETPEDSLSSQELELRFAFSGDRWELTNRDELETLLLSGTACDWDAFAQELYAGSLEKAEYIPIHYKIEEGALSGPEPDQSRFGETEDPAEIAALLETPLAKALIGGQTLAWNPELDFIPGRPIRYYLDESLLVLVWQEPSSRAVGTFSEVITANGSQLRRRIGGDEFESLEYETTTAFAEKTNGVLTLGGDFYHHSRACGIVVYERDIYRFEPDTCDTCYITGDGDMLFSYREQFSTWEEAQAFVEENDVLFSLCFGPVLIDNGVDVTPEQYPWGEIHDNYARSVLGMLGPHHYLTVNINCELPDYYYLVTLRQAADAVVEKGCVKAYALDGGQTATTVLNGQLINPVQFGWEKGISDVIYFATAVPNE